MNRGPRQTRSDGSGWTPSPTRSLKESGGEWSGSEPGCARRSEPLRVAASTRGRRGQRAWRQQESSSAPSAMIGVPGWSTPRLRDHAPRLRREGDKLRRGGSGGGPRRGAVLGGFVYHDNGWPFRQAGKASSVRTQLRATNYGFAMDGTVAAERLGRHDQRRVWPGRPVSVLHRPQITGRPAQNNRLPGPWGCIRVQPRRPPAARTT